MIRRAKALEADILAESDLGRRVLSLREEKDNLLDTVWLATSSSQIKELWEQVNSLLEITPTALEDKALKIAPPAGGTVRQRERETNMVAFVPQPRPQPVEIRLLPQEQEGKCRSTGSSWPRAMPWTTSVRSRLGRLAHAAQEGVGRSASGLPAGLRD